MRGRRAGTVRFAAGEFSRSRVAENGDGLERSVVDVFRASRTRTS